MAFVGIHPDPHGRVPKGTILSMLGVSITPGRYLTNGEYDPQKQADEFNGVTIAREYTRKEENS